MARTDEYDLDALLAKYLGPAHAAPHIGVAGVARLQADFARETEPGQRLALWLVLTMVGAAPSVAASFPDKRDRITARTLAELLAISGRVMSGASRSGPSGTTSAN